MRLNGFILASHAGTMVTACVAMGPAQTAGGVLTNPSGMTLYVFDKDVAESGKSACMAKAQRNGRR